MCKKKIDKQDVLRKELDVSMDLVSMSLVSVGLISLSLVSVNLVSVNIRFISRSSIVQ